MVRVHAGEQGLLARCPSNGYRQGAMPLRNESRLIAVHRLLIATMLSVAMLVAGCGWSPPGAPPPSPTPANRPTVPACSRCKRRSPVSRSPRPARRGPRLPAGIPPTAGFTGCRSAPTIPTSIALSRCCSSTATPRWGTATPEPRPYINVLNAGDDTVVVQYQWQQGNDAPCCPTGIGTVRFQIGEDGKLKPIDPIPNP